MHAFSRYRVVFVVLAILPLAGCLFRSRRVERLVSTAPLKSATQAELLDYINGQAAKVRSLQATVDIDTSVGGIKKGKVIDYQQIRGYILARKPAMLRMIGLLPIVRNKAFDMVSDGRDFKLWIPPKNRFVVGRNDEAGHNPQPTLENMRPQQIYEVLIMPEIDPGETAVREITSEIVTDAKHHQVEQSAYQIDVTRNRTEHAEAYLSRKIIFSRTDLLPHRQLIYDQDGNLVTDSRYEGYEDYDGVKFPTQVEIWRPQEEYDITLTIVKLELNTPLPDDKFALEQPAGAEVVHLDRPRSGPPGGTDGK
jgi:outer membrane lipoprotein-sorting protein